MVARAVMKEYMYLINNHIKSTEIELFLQLNHHFDERAAAKEPTELFIKNIGLC